MDIITSNIGTSFTIYYGILAFIMMIFFKSSIHSRIKIPLMAILSILPLEAFVFFLKWEYFSLNIYLIPTYILITIFLCFSPLIIIKPWFQKFNNFTPLMLKLFVTFASLFVLFRFLPNHGFLLKSQEYYLFDENSFIFWKYWDYSILILLASLIYLEIERDEFDRCDRAISSVYKNNYNWVSGLLNLAPDVVVSRQLSQGVAPGHILLPAASIGRRAYHALLNYGG